MSAEVETTIDRTAHIHPTAEIGRGVVIGPYCVIGEQAVVGDGTVLRPHASIGPFTTLGRNNTIHSFASVGGDPQDLLWQGEETWLVMGDGNVVREGATINRGTFKSDGFTRIGNANLIMANAHIAHDCVIGDHVVMANNCLLAGHVVVEDRAILNGAAAVQQFTTIGRLAYVGGLTRVVQDAPPYMIVEGHPARVRKVNVVGLQRNGRPPETIQALRDAFRALFRSRLPRAEEMARLESAGGVVPEVTELIEFLRRVDGGKHGRSRSAGTKGA